MGSKVNNFDVLKRMAAENRDIRMGIDLVKARRVKAGTQVTIGIAGDCVGSIFAGDLRACLILFDKRQFDEIAAVMEKEPGPSQST